MKPDEGDDDTRLTPEENDALKVEMSKSARVLGKPRPPAEKKPLEERLSALLEEVKEESEERWRADLRASLTGILANPNSDPAHMTVHIQRAVKYADALGAIHDLKAQGKA